MMESEPNTTKDILLALGESAGFIITGILLGFWAKFKGKKTQQIKEDKNNIRSHSQVNEVLTELRVLLQCSRSIIFQYHNGGKFADGTSIKRFSVTHESDDFGVQSMILESQDVLTTRYSELIKILEDIPSTIISVDSIVECSFRTSLEINNVLYFSVSPLKCMDSITPMGFVCCHWCKDMDSICKEGIKISELEQVIEQNAKIINTHLSYRKKNANSSI